MNDQSKDNMKRKSTWMRGLYMLMYFFLASIADIVLIAVAIFQFIHLLVSGDANARLTKLGQGLASYVYQIIQFLTFNSEYHPYPLGAWPKGEIKAANSVQKADSAET